MLNPSLKRGSLLSLKLSHACPGVDRQPLQLSLRQFLQTEQSCNLCASAKFVWLCGLNLSLFQKALILIAVPLAFELALTCSSSMVFVIKSNKRKCNKCTREGECLQASRSHAEKRDGSWIGVYHWLRLSVYRHGGPSVGTSGGYADEEYPGGGGRDHKIYCRQ